MSECHLDALFQLLHMCRMPFKFYESIKEETYSGAQTDEQKCNIKRIESESHRHTCIALIL